jgi:hypothetical protein
MSIISDIFSKLKRNLIWVLIPSIIVGALYGMYTRKIPGKYTSYSKIFPLTAAESSDPTAGLKASFGIGGGGSSLSKYYNVNELVTSRNLSRRIVQYPSKNKENPKLYEWIIKDYNNSLPMFKNKISLAKDSMDNILLAADLFVRSTKINIEKSDFTAIRVTSCNSDLSLRLNECIIECISDFYVNSKTAKARADLSKIGQLRDSLRGVMDLLLYKQADLSDKSLFATKLIASLPQAKLERMRTEVEEAYGVSLTAYTNANFKLMSESPIFQVLDKPSNPTIFEINSWKKSFAIAFIITFILLSLLVIRKQLFSIVSQEFNKL